MSIAATFSVSLTVDGASYAGGKAATGSRRVQYDEAIPTATTVIVTEAIDQSAIQAIYMKATGGDVTLETNGGGTGTSDTLTLTNGVADFWYVGMNASCPITVDVTQFALWHSEASSVAVEIEIVVDATPPA